MAFPIEDKLVIAVASSALFRLDVADEIYRSKGLSAYRQYQREHEDTILEPGIAFPFIRRFLPSASVRSNSSKIPSFLRRVI